MDDGPVVSPVRAGRNKIESFPDFRRNADLGAEEIDDTAVQFPECHRMRIENGENGIAVVDEERGRTVRRFDGALRPENPRRAVIYTYLLDWQRKSAVLVHHRHVQSLHTVRCQNPAAVAVTLLLIILARLHINDRILRKKSEVFYRGEVCGSEQHYSMITFSRLSLPRTMPRLELRMKFRISSFSGLSGNPSWIRAQASEML